MAAAHSIRETSGCGQAPPCYYAATRKALRIVDGEMRSAWVALRSRIVPEKDRTYWQLVRCAEHETPSMQDIATALVRTAS